MFSHPHNFIGANQNVQFNAYQIIERLATHKFDKGCRLPLQWEWGSVQSMQLEIQQYLHTFKMHFQV